MNQFLKLLLVEQKRLENAWNYLYKQWRKNNVDEFKDFKKIAALRTAFEVILEMEKRDHLKVSLPDIYSLPPDPESRLEMISLYFHKLNLNERIVLALMDVFGLSTKETSAIMRQPEGSLLWVRSQALKNLEDWTWGES